MCSSQLGKVVHKPERQLEVLLSEGPGAIGRLDSLQCLLTVACMQLFRNLQRAGKVTIVQPQTHLCVPGHTDASGAYAS